MAEKRRYKRVSVDGRIDGKVVLASEIDIIDISLGGIHFTCTKRILTNSKCVINLKHGNRIMAFSGNVVRSIFKGTKTSGTENMPLYEVAMEFTRLSDDRIDFLKALIDSLDEKT